MDRIENIGVRIKKIVEEEGIMVMKFCEKIGITTQTYNQWWKGLNSPNVKHVIKILEIYSEYNMEWLIMGSGEMKKGKNNEQGNMNEDCKKRVNKLKELTREISKELEKM